MLSTESTQKSSSEFSEGQKPDSKSGVFFTLLPTQFQPNKAYLVLPTPVCIVPYPCFPRIQASFLRGRVFLAFFNNNYSLKNIDFNFLLCSLRLILHIAKTKLHCKSRNNTIKANRATTVLDLCERL